jgi:hypothetical protein
MQLFLPFVSSVALMMEAVSRLHGATFQITVIFILVAVRTGNLNQSPRYITGRTLPKTPPPKELERN